MHGPMVTTCVMAWLYATAIVFSIYSKIDENGSIWAILRDIRIV